LSPRGRLILALFFAVLRPTVAQEGGEPIVPFINRYCGACHAVPPPDVQPRDNWAATIRIMVEIMQTRSGRAQITEQQMREIVAFYQQHAPTELPALPYDEIPAPLEFTARIIGAASPLPMVTHLGSAERPGELLACDGEAGKVLHLVRARGAWREQSLADIKLPVHTQVLDLDADGDRDILVADLGELPPVDAPVGKLWLLRQSSPGRYQRELLADGLGRVSDARAVDLDNDGDLDIAVAVFGGIEKGEVFWLERTGDAADPRYARHELLTLSGAIGVEPVDLDTDGRMDLVLLLAQEHEAILVFLNKGDRVFERATLARAPHPMYGSTSLSTVDLDRDGDVDLLFTNGDAFDGQTDPKPYHGVQWLENLGGLKFQFHGIGRFYGAATATAGDLDGDGDVDVVAGSWVNDWRDPQRHAVVWYENDGKQGFTAHGIATRPAGIATLKLIDVTGDGRLDIVAGAIRMDLLMAKYGAKYRASRLFPETGGAPQPRVLVFENRGKAQAPQAR
jgi:FG-GAP-like repeat